MYNLIYEFCKVKNKGNARKNGKEIPPRVLWIIEQCEKLNIEYKLDSFITTDESNLYHNIILTGSSKRMVTAHHDIVNIDSDNANDNSASVINALVLKTLCPNVTIVLLDGEECGGIGSKHLTEQIKSGEYTLDWILNLELTGKGGDYFFIGDYPGPLQDHIKKLFNPPITITPFNDSVIFREGGIDSCVINSLPLFLNEKVETLHNESVLDYSYLYNCHKLVDTLDSISIIDMKKFTENVLTRIVNE